MTTSGWPDVGTFLKANFDLVLEVAVEGGAFERPDRVVVLRPMAVALPQGLPCSGAVSRNGVEASTAKRSRISGVTLKALGPDGNLPAIAPDHFGVIVRWTDEDIAHIQVPCDQPDVRRLWPGGKRDRER